MANVLIKTQYYENYSDTDVPHWKPKFGHEFVIKDVDATDVLYCNDLAEKLKKLVTQQNNSMERFEYIDHEVQFGEPSEIPAEDLAKLII